MVKTILHLLFTVGTLVFDDQSSTASVAEGENATVCISITSSATTLGCDLTINLTNTDSKAIGKIKPFPAL